MGCGGSKLGPAHEIIMPPKLMPVLHKRFEELTRRRRKGCSLKDQTTLSKKVLLDSDNVSDEDGNDQKSVSSDEDNGLMKVAPATPGSEETMRKEIKIIKAVEIKPVLLVCPTFATMLPVYEEPYKDIEEDVQAAEKVEVSVESKKQSEEHEVENKKTESSPHVEIASAPLVVVAEVESIPTTPVGVNKKDKAITSAPPLVVAEVEADMLNTSKRSTKEDKDCEEIEEQEKKVVVVQASESNAEDVEVSETKGEDSDNEDEDEDICDCADERLLCPGSPSFRVYCIQSDIEDEEIEVTKKLESKETKGSDAIESVAKMKKVKRGGRFRKVKLIPKAKPMKNLLKVQSCYNPACGGSLEKVRLLSSKSPAPSSC